MKKIVVDELARIEDAFLAKTEKMTKAQWQIADKEDFTGEVYVTFADGQLFADITLMPRASIRFVF